ncbi:MAG TPA: S53 family peptidase [Steroidobacteraceae bacterium]|jgi:subtilase family serine protease|nr:S53 family peptidase [Steroidobacteraceae bacterium]
MRFHQCFLTAACAVGFLGAAAASNQHFAAQPQDAGTTAASTLVTTSIILNVTDLKGLENYVAQTATPGNPNFQHFLTVNQFVKRYAPSNQQIKVLVKFLESFGITVNEVYADNLDISVTGTASQLNAALSTQLHDYTRNGQRFHRPAWKFVLPGELSTLVLAIPGLNNQPSQVKPRSVHLGQGAYAGTKAAAVTWPRNGTASGVPEDYTVGDTANFYDFNPLYKAGIDGKGQTIGIMTLANFKVSDVTSYWQDIGLKVKANRVTKVLVDGGTPVKAGVGDNETSIDVEQSGGLAPKADIRVYIAPNTLNGFLDVFYSAASENVADSVSISWGQAEEDYFAATNGGVDYTDQLTAIHQALLEGAAQGQSYFTSAGDDGAYDVNDANNAPVPLFSKQLTVDAPANDPAITAAGGTTVAATEPGIPSAGCPDITISQEQVWGWDYIARDWANCLANLGLTAEDLFPSGGGGGVSSFWDRPFYQQGTAGIQRTQPGQSLIFYPNYPDLSGAELINTLPANFAGRNVPDLSFNADPQTGYVVVDCTDFPEPANPNCAQGGWGGTSFVAPQLNGMTALIDEASGGRVGLLNPVVYGLQALRVSYSKGGPFNDITAGDNYFYDGVRGYDDGAGIGTVNAANLAFIYMALAELRF